MSAGMEELGADVLSIAPEAVAPEDPSPSGAAAPQEPEEAKSPSDGELLQEDLDRLDPVPDELTLANGQRVSIQRLRTRQFFAMLRIVTRSAIPVLGRINLDPRTQTEEEFTQNLLTVLMLSIPEADEETFDFLTAMVEPADLDGTKEKELEERANLVRYMRNPELDDTVSLVEAIVRREAPDLKALGKRLVQMFRLAQKTGQTKELETAQAGAAASSEGSQGPSTS